MKYLLIAEKPSLMRSIQETYQKHKSEVVDKVGYIDFIALAGHVCANYMPKDYVDWKDEKWNDINYPMIPKTWKIKPSDDVRKKQLLKTIKEKIGDYDGIIVGTDSDQEGYGIYYLLEHYLRLENMKTLRFMEHSLTDSEILKSLLSMTDYHTDPVHVNFTKAFMLRSRADWLYGMNLTGMMTVKVGELQRIGRVKAPTIQLVYNNSMSIDNFQVKKYWQLEADYGTFKSTYVKEGKPVQAELSSMLPTPPLQGIVTNKTTERVVTHAPKLYDLTAIQADAGSKFGFTPTKTLELIQSLYEKHKIVSYPRTQCQFVSEAKSKEFKDMISLMKVFPELADYAKNVTDEDIERVRKDKKVVNDKEVQKESHDALLPTDKIPDVSALKPDEYKICLMIYKRLLAQFLPQLEEDKTKLEIAHGDYSFVANGKTVINKGWKDLYGDLKETSIPMLSKGDTVTAKEMSRVEKTTTPPKRLTQASLIAAMKNIGNQIEDAELKKSLNDSQGIGTPATRAKIIDDIIKSGYVEDKKGGLYITDLGKVYVKNLEGIDIVSPVFAAKLDTEIKKIQRGEAEYDAIYKSLLENLRQVCIQVNRKAVIRPVMKYTCKKCGTQLEDSKYSYVCPQCDFKIPKTLCGVPITETMIEEMYDGKMTGTKHFTSKAGKKFDARLKLGNDGVEFDFSSGVKCPICGKDIRINKGGFFCDCGLKLWRSGFGHDFSDKELKKLCSDGILKQVSCVSKAGKNYTADIVIDKDEKKAKLDFGGSDK